MPEPTMAVEPYLRTSRSEAKASKKGFIKMPKLDMPREFLSWETAGAVLALILLTRLHLMGELAPFGLAFWAVAGRGESRRMILYGAVMLMATVFEGGVFYPLELLLGMVTFTLLWFRLRKIHMPYVLVIGL
ncbi:MAG: hypothetical protein NUK65_06830, partial [Firmicutes bacterium]|nr:hypothetical protein [Bacillota bacterium]